MIQINWAVTLAAALIPMVMGFIWYNPKVVGTAWMKEAGMDEEKMKGANMGLIFGLAFLLSVFLSLAVNFLCIHQFHLNSMLMNEPGFNEAGSETNNFLLSTMEKYGNCFRTFKHGVVHGIVGALLIVLPVFGTNALFERKSLKYVAINVGYWAITMALMGGVICQFT